MSNRVKQEDLLPFWVKNQKLSLPAFAEKYRSTFGVETTDASIRVRLYSVRKRALAAGFEPPNVPKSDRKRGRPSASQIDENTFSKFLKKA
tara:strand:- start:851 stop:1123 length:273 start_codon:yes stop_codon:yes gene_type:complete